MRRVPPMSSLKSMMEPRIIPRCFRVNEPEDEIIRANQKKAGFRDISKFMREAALRPVDKTLYRESKEHLLELEKANLVQERIAAGIRQLVLKELPKDTSLEKQDLDKVVERIIRELNRR